MSEPVRYEYVRTFDFEGIREAEDGPIIRYDDYVATVAEWKQRAIHAEAERDRYQYGSELAGCERDAAIAERDAAREMADMFRRNYEEKQREWKALNDALKQERDELRGRLGR